MKTRDLVIFSFLLIFFTFLATATWQKVRLYNAYAEMVQSGEMFTINGKYYRYCENKQIVSYQEK